jgi:hypothetical protein
MTVTVITAGSALTSAKVRAQNYKQVGALMLAKGHIFQASSRIGRQGRFRFSPDRYFFRQYFMQMTYSLLHASRV